MIKTSQKLGVLLDSISKEQIYLNEQIPTLHNDYKTDNTTKQYKIDTYKNEKLINDDISIYRNLLIFYRTKKLINDNKMKSPSPSAELVETGCPNCTPEMQKGVKTENKKSKIKKEAIPKAVRIKVWSKYIGKYEAKGKCFCCRDKVIDQQDFQCGHIQSEHNGGKVNIQNLRPICGMCNRSMGTKNMFEFMEQYGFDTNHI
jgi:hypothetical protein